MSDERRPFDDTMDDPEQRFGTPAAVIEATDLSEAEKVAILQRWRLDALRLCDSEQEGMGGGENAHLAEIERLLLDLGAE